jgi:type I restriction enzyme, R subunit
MHPSHYWGEGSAAHTLHAGPHLVYELPYRCRYAHRRLARLGSPRSWSPRGVDRAAPCRRSRYHGVLLKGELKTRRRKNVVQARSFAEMLEQTLRRYQNRGIEAAQVIEELIALAKEMRQANARGEALDLTEDELAFYDALETNDSAVKVLGDETLRTIARELVATVRSNVTIDWTLRENVRAQLRVLVKRILRKYGYPPDKQEKATQTVLEQAALLSADWAA